MKRAENFIVSFEGDRVKTQSIHGRCYRLISNTLTGVLRDTTRFCYNYLNAFYVFGSPKVGYEQGQTPPKVPKKDPVFRRIFTKKGKNETECRADTTKVKKVLNHSVFL
jgi:hypothetical protein